MTSDVIVPTVCDSLKDKTRKKCVMESKLSVPGPRGLNVVQYKLIHVYSNVCVCVCCGVVP